MALDSQMTGPLDHIVLPERCQTGRADATKRQSAQLPAVRNDRVYGANEGALRRCGCQSASLTHVIKRQQLEAVGASNGHGKARLKGEQGILDP